jgi:hypothetical protein
LASGAGKLPTISGLNAAVSVMMSYGHNRRTADHGNIYNPPVGGKQGLVVGAAPCASHHGQIENRPACGDPGCPLVLGPSIRLLREECQEKRQECTDCPDTMEKLSVKLLT